MLCLQLYFHEWVVWQKLQDVLSGADAFITNSHKLEPHEIFNEIYKNGVSDEEMYKTFNCGIGFVFGIDKNNADKFIADIKEFKADVVGEVVNGGGEVVIQSKFSNCEIVYK